MSDKTPDQPTNRGFCLCGAITFSIEGPPVYNVVCHCENCKRQGGSTLHCASIFLRKQYTLLSGSEMITTYADYNTQSRQPLYRAFCKVCGSKVSAKTPLNEGIISIPAGVLEGAGGGWTPSKEQFCEKRCEWVPEFGGMVRERFDKGPTGRTVQGLTKL